MILVQFPLYFEQNSMEKKMTGKKSKTQKRCTFVCVKLHKSQTWRKRIFNIGNKMHYNFMYLCEK